MVNFTVVIVDNDVNECSKDFFLDLEILPAAAAMGVVKGPRHNATVTITEEQSGKWCSNAAYATMHHITILCKTHHVQVHCDFSPYTLMSNTYVIKACVHTCVQCD